MPDQSVIIQLIDAICVAWDNPDYYPVFENGVLKTTFCNRFVNDVALAMGYTGFQDHVTKQALTADNIMHVLETDPRWQEIRCAGLPPDQREMALRSIQTWANQGYLTLAGLSSAVLASAHGHVCCVRPGLLRSSGKWGDIPSVANVGRENFIGRAKSGVMRGLPVGVNESFIQMPKFYSLRPPKT